MWLLPKEILFYCFSFIFYYYFFLAFSVNLPSYSQSWLPSLPLCRCKVVRIACFTVFVRSRFLFIPWFIEFYSPSYGCWTLWSKFNCCVRYVLARTTSRNNTRRARKRMHAACHNSLIRPSMTLIAGSSYPQRYPLELEVPGSAFRWPYLVPRMLYKHGHGHFGVRNCPSSTVLPSVSFRLSTYHV